MYRPNLQSVALAVPERGDCSFGVGLRTPSVVVKDLRLKDKDKDLMSKDEDLSLKDKDLAGINTHISCRHRARSHVISCILSLSCHR